MSTKRNLRGLFDFTLRFSQEGLVMPDGTPLASPDKFLPPGLVIDRGPILFTAIQEIGLKLEPAKGPVEVLVVDSVQRPSDN